MKLTVQRTNAYPCTRAAHSHRPRGNAARVHHCPRLGESRDHRRERSSHPKQRRPKPYNRLPRLRLPSSVPPSVLPCVPYQWPPLASTEDEHLECTSAWQDEHSGKQLSTVSTLSLSLLSIRTIVRAAVRCHPAPLSSGPCFGEENQAMTSRLLEPKWLRIYN